jgi:hypothetical protein
MVLGLANQLRVQGIDCTIDQYEESPEEGWIEWMEAQVTNSSYVLVVCSKGYFEKLQTNNGDQGKGARWEGAIIKQEIFSNNGKNPRFVPVIFGEENKTYIPRVIRAVTYYDVLTESGYENLYRRLTKQPVIQKPPVGNVVPFPAQPCVRFDPKRQFGQEAPRVSQVATGKNNVQIGGVIGDVVVHTQGGLKVLVLPPPGTIGANSLLKQAIKERFNKIGEEREKRFGKNAYQVMYKNFKRDFEIQNQAWTVIWDWPEAIADAIIAYLDVKHANTIAGRNEEAIARGTMIPGKGHLFAREKELLAHLGLEVSSPEVKEALHKFFGVTTHTKLTKSKHWQWVLYLETQVRELIGE